MLDIKNRYVVLTLCGELVQFPQHKPAFKYCENHAAKIKGVYKIIDAQTVGAINVWTNSKFWEGESKLQQKHKQLTFKVI